MSDDQAALFGQLEDVFAAVDADDIDNFTDEQEWPTAKLIQELSRLTEYVKEQRQILHPRSQETRDAHARRNAVQLELNRRGVL